MSESTENPEDHASLRQSIYEDLRKLARGRIAKAAGSPTMQPTELVHEAYLRLQGRDLESNDRSHFVAIAARAMRFVLVDESRRKHSLKRGGMGGVRVDLTHLAQEGTMEWDVLDVDEALSELEAIDERKARVVELRFFAGATTEETAATLGVSVDTVKRDWRYTRRWLSARLRDRTEEGS